MRSKFLRIMSAMLITALLLSTCASALRLERNDRSDHVRALQQALKQLGYYSGELDGHYGSGTEAAVTNYQKAQNIKVDGIAGSGTIALLEKQTGIDIDGSSNSSVDVSGLFKGDYTKLEWGDSGSRVRILQKALKDLGFSVTVDGVFGKSTHEAVKAFQDKAGLSEDGKAGKKTLTKLESYFDANGKVIKPLVTPGADPDNIAYGVPKRTLREGMGGQDVVYTQDRLASLGYYTGLSDGKYGSGTKAAVKAFQKRNSLNADGVLGTKTIQRLFSAGAISADEKDNYEAVGDRKLTLGMEGEDVKTVQKQLAKLGYYTGKQDGKYGTGTRAAVLSFQKRNKLTADGICGEDTVMILFSDSAVDAGSSVKPSLPGEITATKPNRILRLGAKGDDVTSVQYRLDLLGYYSGSLDGKYGTGTAMAVSAFQKRNGLTVDGKVGTLTANALYSSSAIANDASSSTPSTGTDTGYGVVPTRTLRDGDEGEDVKSVQSRLMALGYYSGSVDGKFGSTTSAALTAFQLRNSLSADGVAGSSTYKKLYSASAVPNQAMSDTPSTGVSGTRPTRVLYSGCQGDDVKSVQNRLKALGYFKSTVDGKFGSLTESALRAFQQKNSLTATGQGDSATYSVLYSINAITANGLQTDGQPTSYTILRVGATGSAVVALQQALSNLRYTVTVNGTYDAVTQAAVLAFQRRNGLSADGVAGVQTQTKLYSDSCVTGDTALPDDADDSSSSGSVGGNFGSGPATSQVKWLMWYDEIKPIIKSGQTALVYEPASGSLFNIRFYSLGRHADSEPLTAQDTAIMKAAWGGKFAWTEKPVYVRLPNGTWCIASMHSMPHLSGSIKDNNFDGHLCIHFPRTLEETAEKDPKNGVRHQKDIRKQWLKITGEDITW